MEGNWGLAQVASDGLRSSIAAEPEVGGIPFAALDRQHSGLRAELFAVFDRVVSSSAFILGREVESFERDFAAFCATEHCVGVASGTAALSLILAAAGIGRGDEVILGAHGFVASALAVQHAGAEPVFSEVDPSTGLLDADAAAECVTERTAAIMPVHLYGQMCEMDPIMELAQRCGLFVLEDAAQAHGAEHRGRRAGSVASAGAFSFYPSKNLGALGDAGAVTTDDAQLASRVRELRDLGRQPGAQGFTGGRNERLDGLQAAVLSVKLRHLEGWNAARREHAARYRDALEGAVELLEERLQTPCVYHLFPIRVGERDRLARELGAAGIATGVHYSPALYRQPPFNGPPASSFPHADRWARQELSLPISPELRPDERERVSQAVLRAHVGTKALARG